MRMRLRFRYKYRNYPLSKELTERSMKTGFFTHPFFGIILGVLPGMLSAFLFPSSVGIPLCLLYGGMVAGPILLSFYRKKKFAQYDAEYIRLLQSMRK